MKKTAIFLFFSALFIASASAQWQTTTYTLKGGWNSIYLHGDASYDTPDELFPNSGDSANIEQVWRWNPNPTQIQFTTDPLIPTAGTPEWSVWDRGNPGASTLSALTGQTAYLVYCSGTIANSYSVQIKNRPQPPASTWVRNGANLLGFPTNATSGYPTLSNYFATFPAAIAANAKIYKYVGGELGPANPLQVFSPSFESLDRNQAYWFEAEVTGSYYAPIEIAPANSAGLEFGRTGSVLAVRIRNRTDAAVTMTIAPTSSAAAPAGETGITGDVPLTYDGSALSTFNVVVGPQASIELEFGINRSLMGVDSGALYASFLKFTDSGNLMDVLIPASAQVASMAGLWVGDATVDGVVSTVAGSPGDTTRRSFPLRYILHVDDGGTARLLSQVFMGTLDASDQLGHCTNEADLKPEELASAVRIVAAHMPLDLALSTGTGSVALGGTLERTINLPFNAKTNPFVHSYHPDHDNKDPRNQALLAGVESYDVTRAVSFEFLATPPTGTPSIGWGTTVLGGEYSETLTGIHKLPLSTSGTFTFRRVNEIGAITITP
jgi:hypothetical protein